MTSKQNGLGSAATDNQALTPDTVRSAKEAPPIVTPILTNTASVDLALFGVGEHRISCPRCAKRASDKSLGVTVKAPGDAVAHCFRCGLTQSLRNKRAALNEPIFRPQTPSQVKRTSLSQQGRSLWTDCMPISGTALLYLKSRYCVIPPIEGDLRWHSDLKHPSGYRGAALVGLVTHVLTGEPLSLHRTWITPNRKADVVPNRLLLGGHTAKHGVIRLYPDEYTTTGLGIAEGIETTLSLAHEYQPVWAAISAGNMGSLPVLSGIECLTVAVDSDDAGRKAANNLSMNWHAAGVKVRHALVGHGDLNDNLETRCG